MARIRHGNMRRNLGKDRQGGREKGSLVPEILPVNLKIRHELHQHRLC